MKISVPAALPATLASIHGQIQGVSGWLTAREIEFLALAAACPTAEGRVLEIGCYHGKSTIVLAVATQLADRQPIYSVDPIDPAPLRSNLQRASVEGRVLFHQGYSQQYLRSWRQPIRMLWHDGSNHAHEVREDIELCLPHLADGAIVAFHDVLNTSGERLHAFVDEVLRSEQFGPAGVCGSIGWAQFRRRPEASVRHLKAKLQLARGLERLRPYHKADHTRPKRWQRCVYKLHRWRVPHGRIAAGPWLVQVAGGHPVDLFDARLAA